VKRTSLEVTETTEIEAQVIEPRKRKRDEIEDLSNELMKFEDDIPMPDHRDPRLRKSRKVEPDTPPKLLPIKEEFEPRPTSVLPPPTENTQHRFYKKGKEKHGERHDWRTEA
jgi:hypothetical protein